jgi:hypothetical protein
VKLAKERGLGKELEGPTPVHNGEVGNTVEGEKKTARGMEPVLGGCAGVLLAGRCVVDEGGSGNLDSCPHPAASGAEVGLGLRPDGGRLDARGAEKGSLNPVVCLGGGHLGLYRDFDSVDWVPAALLEPLLQPDLWFLRETDLSESAAVEGVAGLVEVEVPHATLP